MFSQACVVLFTGGGGGLCPSMHYRSHDQGGLCLGGSLYKGVSVWGISVQGGLCPGGSLSRGGSVQGGLCPGGALSRGVSVQGVSLSRGVSVRETPRTVTSGWYASYWNAFLLDAIS